MAYLSCRLFDGGELSSVCVQNKNTLTYCIYIYAAVMLLSSLGDSVGVFLCRWYAVIVLLLLFVESFSSDTLQLLDTFLVKLV